MKYLTLILLLLNACFIMAQDLSSHDIVINGINLHYTKAGRGSPLLLLHGWTQSSIFWERYLKEYAKNFEVYAIDLRGHGKSTPLSDDFTIQKSADDIVCLIRELKLKNVNAIGLSFGGLILLEIASKEKKLLDRIVLIGTSSQYDGKAANEGKPAFSYEDLDHGFKDQLISIHQGGEAQVRSLFRKDLNYAINIPPAKLKGIKAKAFIIQGESDEIVGQDAARMLHKNIYGSQLWIVPAAGHLALNDKTRNEFIRRTLDFLYSDR